MKKVFVLSVLCLLTLLNVPLQGDASVQFEPVPEKNPIRSTLTSPECLAWVDRQMNAMSLEEQVGQLFIYTLRPTSTPTNLTLMKRVVDEYHVGGLLFSGGTVGEQAALTNRAQAMARIPLLITFDGEWGLAMRLKGTPNFPRNQVLGCITDLDLLRAYGQEMARQCKEMGVQVNFAPVADVNTNPRNPVINVRSFGEQPRTVASRMVAYAQGLESAGVLSVAKHFPGHGDTETDSHKVLPLLKYGRERLDSVELLPFRAMVEAGLNGVMVGHLEVPALDPSKGMPASLSPKVVNRLLITEMGFQGLVFTDALQMKGVAAHRHPSLKALKAGNDLVLVSPPKIKEEIQAVLSAVKRGEFTKQEVERKCRKVLAYKYALGLHTKPNIRLEGLNERLNDPRAQALIDKLHCAAVTVLKNERTVLPLPIDRSQPIALIELVGERNQLKPLAEGMRQYADVRRFVIEPDWSSTGLQAVCDSVAKCGHIVIAVAEHRSAEKYASLLTALEKHGNPLYLFFSAPKTVLTYKARLQTASAVLLAHVPDAKVQTHVSDVLFAAASATGRLSSSIGTLFPAGTGVDITKNEPQTFAPEDLSLSTPKLQRIDSIAQAGIAQGAYPGCRVVVMKDGYTVLDKSYGRHAGVGSREVDAASCYDLASLTKTSATLLAVMKLYDKGQINLTDEIATYLPFLRNTDKASITVQDLLFHESGLPAAILFYQEAIDPDSYTGRLFGNRRSAKHSLHLGGRVWANPRFDFYPRYVSSQQKEGFSRPIAQDLWVSDEFRSLIQQKIAQTPLRSATYRYSDVGFVLLGMMVEEVSGMPLHRFLEEELYKPMGLHSMTYLPLERMESHRIVPTANDTFLRKSLLQGYVHDETAAFSGGVAGNAGLFSTAGDVARLYQMFLDGGVLDGQRFLSEQTCRLFTTAQSAKSRRGLGFDRPDPTDPDKGNCAPGVPTQVYGHTGFTGTCAWVDPVNRLVYVFLCNRIYPQVTNRKLLDLSIRERIQAAIYEALLPPSE